MSTVSQTAATGSEDAEAAATALEFSLSTNPDPIRVSPNTGDPQRADLVIVGSRRSGEAIECNKIVVVIPTGPNSPDLALDLEGIDPQTSLKDWTATTNAQAKTITFAPTSGHATISRDEGLTVQLMGVRINRQVGTAPLLIQVYSRPAGSSESFLPDTTTLEIGKFPADFYLRNLIAKPPIINNGETVTLTWEAGGVSSLRLLYDTTDVNVLDKSTYTLNNVGHTTQFYLRATVQIGNGTAERILNTTATVRVPDLEVGSLFVRGAISNLRYGTEGNSSSAPWSQANVPTLFGHSMPTLFKYNNQLHFVASAFQRQEPLWATLHGETWIITPTNLPPAACEEPAFLEVNNKLYCVYRTPDNAMHRTIGTADPTQPGQLAWSTPTRITTKNWTTTHKPTLVQLLTGPNCGFRHPDGSIYFGAIIDDTPPEPTNIPVKTTHGPAAASTLLGPQFAYRAEDGAVRVTLVTGDGAPIPGARTSDGPAFVPYLTGVACAYRDESGKLRYSANVLGSWLPSDDISPLPGTGSPSVVALNGRLHAIYR
ncbi:hypothetical protein ACFV6D_29930 [Kitasatospora sp. NPDC059812]|uniref:hypothetical protein n=1 Tax=Kitasatospora sp. NPDC059812 TaxID=3346958 RepID=UPI00365A1795